MNVEDLMGSLHAFEMILKQRKRDKLIALKIVHDEEDSSEEDNEDEFALLTKNFRKFLKKVGKSFKSDLSFPNMFKGKNSSTLKNFDFPNKKIVQCRNREGFEHIQSECVNTRKKKNKALKSTWSDEEFEGSQEEDDLVSNQVTFFGTLVYGNHFLLLNNSLNKLDHLITTSKTFGDHNGVRYKGESSSSKTIFVKSGLLDDSINVFWKKPVVKSIATK